MQTLQQELDPSVQGLNAAHPALRELMGNPMIAYAEEVRLLRQRVALLEAELAATKAAQVVEKAAPLPTIDFARASQRLAAAPSVFTEPLTPAVAALGVHPPAALQPAPAPGPDPAAPSAPATPPTLVADVVTSDPTDADVVVEPVPNPGFAQAWSAEEPDSSFEERVAERAFFEASAVDEESRTWLLAQ